MIDQLNVAFLLVALASCGGGAGDSRSPGCSVPFTTEEGPLDRAYHSYHVTSVPRVLGHLLGASVSFEEGERMVIAYQVDDARYAVTYLVENAP